MSIACWKEADAEKMDYLIAVTDNDAVNMMAAMIRRPLRNTQKNRPGPLPGVRQPNSVLSPEDLKIDLIIHPEELAAQEIAG
jgi:trk system potassium uptake protein TrkA